MLARTISLTLLAAAVAAGASAREPTKPAEASVSGIVGVCIRWTENPNHVSDVFVIEPSGNAELDTALPATVKRMVWPKPDPPYDGAWVGIRLAVGENPVPPTGALPDCSKVPLPPTPPTS